MSKKTRRLITILAIILAALMVIPLVLEMIPRNQTVTMEPGQYTTDENGNLVRIGDVEPEDENETETGEEVPTDDIMLEWDEDTDEQQTTEAN